MTASKSMGAPKRGVAARLVKPFLELHRRSNSGVTDAMLREVGLDPDRMADPETRVPWVVLERAIDLAIRVSGRDELGPAAALLFTDDSFDVPEYVARNKATVYEGLVSLTRYVPLLADGARWDVHDEEEGACAVFTPPPETAHPGIVGFAVAALVVAGRRYAAQSWNSVRVELVQGRPKNLEAYESVFACPLEFGATRNAFWVSHEELRAPMKHANTSLSDSLERIAERMLAEHGPSDAMRDRVRARVVDMLPRGECSMTQVADALEIPVRTLRRRLKEEDVTFREIVDTARFDLSERYLRDTQLSVGEIAYLLGFSTTQAFVRAFKRSRGQTPLKYRRSVS